MDIVCNAYVLFICWKKLYSERSVGGASEMAQQMKVFAARSDDLP